jgi:hypothetical protein
MERAFGDAITIRNEAPRNCAKKREIEVRILEFEGIERPLDEIDAAFQRVLSLKKFQAASYAAVAKFGEDGGHVRVEVGLARPNCG